MNTTYDQALTSAVFEYIASDGIATIDEIAEYLGISNDTVANIVELLIRFGLLEYDDMYALSIKLSKTAKIILE